MSAVPTILPSGYILVYGEGYFPSNQGIYPDNDFFRFGSVYQIWDGGETYVYGGDEVMFDTRLVTTKLFYNNFPYSMIPARLATKQEPPPP